MSTATQEMPQNVDPNRRVYLGEVSINRLVPSPDNPAGRMELTPELESLAETIRRHGVLEEIVTGPLKEGTDPTSPRTKLAIVAGHRRWAASKLAGRKTVPVMYDPTLVGAKADEARLVENLAREDISPLQEARDFERLIRVHGYRQIDVARAIGHNQGHVSKRLQLLKLPAAAQQAIADGRVTVNDGVDLARLNPEAVKKAIGDIQRGSDPPAAIRSAAAWAEQNSDRSAAIKTLQRQNINVILSDTPVHYDALRGPIALRFIQGIDPAAHAELACHAAIVGPAPRYSDTEQTGPVDRWATFVCLDPATHRDATAGEDPDAAEALAEEERRRRQEWSEQFEAAAASRRQFIGRILRGRFVKTSALEHLARATALDALIEPDYQQQQDAFDLAASWLGIDGDTRQQIAERITGKGGDQLIKTTVAVRLAVDDLALTYLGSGRWESVHGPLLTEHLRYLQQVGYTPTEVELGHVSAYADLESYVED